jgi:hypothetical protein
MACPVCFGGADTAMRESLNAGIGVLMGVTLIVLAGFARLIFTLARRSREAAHLVTWDNRPSADFRLEDAAFRQEPGLLLENKVPH